MDDFAEELLAVAGGVMLGGGVLLCLLSVLWSGHVIFF
jgi:hypothetical protein